MIVVHIARIKLTEETGMGRIACNWKSAFERKEHQFIHIGTEEIQKDIHPNLWGFYSKQYLDKLTISPNVILVHEPYSGFFISKNYKTVVFSHGVEERAWFIQKQFKLKKLSFKSKLLPVCLRFYSNRIGFKKTDLILLSNKTDVEYLRQKGISTKKIKVFKNGYDSYMAAEGTNHELSFLFNGSWIERKGIDLLIKVFNKILFKYPKAKLIIAGVLENEQKIKSFFEDSLQNQIKVIPQFNRDEERDLYSEASVFLMLSFFEGQSLALTQAMSQGLCPIVSDNSGQIDFVSHKENGLVFKTGDGADLFNQVDFLINNPDIIKLYGARAQKKVEQLKWNDVSKEVVSICEFIVR